jgi:hypothetical protein
MILGALVATNVHARHQARSRQAPQGAAVVA